MPQSSFRNANLEGDTVSGTAGTDPGRYRFRLACRGAGFAVISAILIAFCANQFAYSQDTPMDDLQPKDSQAAGEEASPKSAPETSTESASSGSTTESKPRQFKTQLIDTSIEEKPTTPQATAGDTQEKSPEYLAHEARLSEPLKKLIQAPYLYDNSKGGSSDLTEAFTLAARDGPRLRDDLLFIVENGSPAGKIYAACLIRNFDPSTGTRILNDFKAVKTLVNNKTYTSQEHYTTGEVALDLLSGSPTIKLRPR